LEQAAVERFEPSQRLSIVDLPEPFGPITPMRSVSLTPKVTPSKERAQAHRFGEILGGEQNHEGAEPVPERSNAWRGG
jgi:hypothetical protein